MKKYNTILDSNDIDYKSIANYMINEYLSDKYGFCVNNYTFNIKIEIDDIDWDLDE